MLGRRRGHARLDHGRLQLGKGDEPVVGIIQAGVIRNIPETDGEGAKRIAGDIQDQRAGILRDAWVGSSGDDAQRLAI